MANPAAITPHALGAETASGNGTAIDLGTSPVRSAARLTLEVVSVTSTTVTHVGTGPAVTFSGTPSDPAANYVIKVTLGGALGVGKYQYSTDAGATYNGTDILLPVGGSAALGSTGITASFAAGTYVLAETYGWAKRLTVSLETSADGGSGWWTVDTFPVTAIAGRVERAYVALSRYVRAVWTLAGDSVTFSVTGDAHQVFFTEQDITSGALPAIALTSVPSYVKADAILKASDDILDALNSAYTPPITAVGDSVKQRGAQIASWTIVSQRGLQVDGPNQLLLDAAEKAQAWLYKVSQGRLRPPGIVDSTPTSYEGGAVVVSGPTRGW